MCGVNFSVGGEDPPEAGLARPSEGRAVVTGLPASGCWRLALSVCSVWFGARGQVNVSAGGSSYLQPSAGPGNNTCIELQPSSSDHPAAL